MTGSRGIRAGKAEILLSIRNQTRQGLKQAQQDLTNFSLRVAQIGATSLGGGLGLAGIFADAVKEYSRVEQLLGRFESVFGDLTRSSGAFADQLAKDINVSKLDLRDQLSRFQAVLVGSGFTPLNAQDLAFGFTKATQDLIAFDDTIGSADEAVRRLLSGLVGETEAVRRFGADVRAGAVSQELLRLGIEKTSAEASESERQLARYNIIMRALGRSGATGQAVREVNTLASRFRGLQAAATDARVALGGTIGPAVVGLTTALTGYVRQFEKFAEAQPEFFQRLAFGVPVLGALGVGLTGLAASLALAGLAVGGVTSLVSALASLVVPTAVIGGLTAAIYGAVTSIDQLTSAGSDLAGFFTDQFSGVQSTILKTVDGIADALEGGRIELAGKIAGLGLELVFEQTFGNITAMYKDLVDEIAKGIAALSPRDLATILAEYGILEAKFAKTFSDRPFVGGEAGQNVANIEYDRQRRQQQREAELLRLREKLAERNTTAAVAQQKAEKEREDARKRQAKDFELPEVQEAKRQASPRSFGTFSGTTASQQFGPTVDRLKDMVNKQEIGNQKLERIARGIESGKVLRWA